MSVDKSLYETPQELRRGLTVKWIDHGSWHGRGIVLLWHWNHPIYRMRIRCGIWPYMIFGRGFTK